MYLNCTLCENYEDVVPHSVVLARVDEYADFVSAHAVVFDCVVVCIGYPDTLAGTDEGGDDAIGDSGVVCINLDAKRGVYDGEVVDAGGVTVSFKADCD